MKSLQGPTYLCDCGRSCEVVATESLWEFLWHCHCGRAGVISWAHASPPPGIGAPTIGQTRLFDDDLDPIPAPA